MIIAPAPEDEHVGEDWQHTSLFQVRQTEGCAQITNFSIYMTEHSSFSPKGMFPIFIFGMPFSSSSRPGAILLMISWGGCPYLQWQILLDNLVHSGYRHSDRQTLKLTLELVALTPTTPWHCQGSFHILLPTFESIHIVCIAYMVGTIR